MQVFPDGVNAIGIAGLIVFLVCGLGAAISFFALGIPKALAELRGPFRVWRHPSARLRFLIFLGFCASGVIVGAIALFFGGWPLEHI